MAVPDHGVGMLARQLDTLIAQPRFAAARWGIAVVSLDSGRTLYAHAADKLFQPASTAKLFTSALVLDTLDPGYRIPTRLLAGPVANGRLDGPLILYGMGDPTLGGNAATADWADQLVRQLGARGITRVRGDLIADDSYFAGPPIGDGWEAGDLQSGFAAPASALSVDENQFRLTVAPAVAGEAAHLHVEPAVAAPALSDDIVTTAQGSGDDIDLYRAPGANLLHAFGRIDARAPAQTFRLAVDDPARTAGEALLQALARHGIRFDGRLRVLHWPDQDKALLVHARVMAEVRSPPLRTILRQGLKRSQNLYLQNLLQLAGVRARADAMRVPSAAAAGFRTSAAWGIQAEKALLQRIGIAPATALIGEGTGLSRRDLVTPNALVRVLGYLAAQPDAAMLRDMLPVAGVDGSLVSRMRGTPAAGNVRAKTGSMHYVSCLAGYVTSAAGEHLAFAIMLNDYAAPADAPASRELDAVAELLAMLDERS